MKIKCVFCPEEHEVVHRIPIMGSIIPVYRCPVTYPTASRTTTDTKETSNADAK